MTALNVHAARDNIITRFKLVFVFALFCSTFMQMPQKIAT